MNLHGLAQYLHPLEFWEEMIHYNILVYNFFSLLYNGDLNSIFKSRAHRWSPFVKLKKAKKLKSIPPFRSGLVLLFIFCLLPTLCHIFLPLRLIPFFLNILYLPRLCPIPLSYSFIHLFYSECPLTD